LIPASVFVEAAREHGFGLVTGVPCSYLEPFINYCIDSEGLRYIGAANEGDAVAIAAGAALGGVPSVAMFQNSGLGNAVSPLTSLTETFRIPILVIVTLRGEPGGAPDEPQHEMMGNITPSLLELMDIRWEYFPEDVDKVGEVLARALSHMRLERRPYALVMRKGSVAPWALETIPDPQPPRAQSARRQSAVCRRSEILAALQSAVADDDVLIASTGVAGRELFAAGDRENQLYMVGSMGCAISLGLGLATARPDRRVIVIDGDGAALMRLGAMCVVGAEQPPNLVHCLLDNGLHESTGGQATVSGSIDFPAIAAASGYAKVMSAATGQGVARSLQAVHPGPVFIHTPILPGVRENLPRPDIAPAEVAERLRGWLRQGSAQ
jgi:phosphonopyruvate decarboxylase